MHITKDFYPYLSAEQSRLPLQFWIVRSIILIKYVPTSSNLKYMYACYQTTLYLNTLYISYPSGIYNIIIYNTRLYRCN